VSAVFGPDASELGPGAAAARWLGGSPDEPLPQQKSRSRPQTPMLKWCRQVNGTLKRERQAVTDEMQKATNMAGGGTPWWKNRPKWKIATNLRFAYTIPATWTAILCDAKPSVSYTAVDKSKQKRADIASAAWEQASSEGKWDRVIRSAVMVSRVQKKGYPAADLRLPGPWRPRTSQAGLHAGGAGLPQPRSHLRR